MKLSLSRFPRSAKGRPFALPDAARRVLRGLVPVVCPDHDGAIDVRAIARDGLLLDEIEASMAAFGDGLRLGLLAGLSAYDLGALARFGARSYRLPDDQARAYFDTWWRVPGPTHEFVKGIKGLICMVYYELPAVQEVIEYRPADWIHMVNARRQERYADDIRAHQESLLAADPLVPTANLTFGPAKGQAGGGS